MSAINVSQVEVLIIENLDSVVAVGGSVLVIWVAINALNYVRQVLGYSTAAEREADFNALYESGEAVAGVDFVDVPVASSPSEWSACGPNGEMGKFHTFRVCGVDKTIFIDKAESDAIDAEEAAFYAENPDAVLRRDMKESIKVNELGSLDRNK